MLGMIHMLSDVFWLEVLVCLWHILCGQIAYVEKL